MDLSLHLQQKAEMNLALTPQLKQSLEILKYSMQELENYIREEANANPLIELTEQQSSELMLDMARLHNNEHTHISSFTSDESFDPFCN